MNDLDDALRHARADLRNEAARIAGSESVLTDIHDGASVDARGPSGNGRWLGLVAAAVMVVGGLVALQVVTSDRADPAAPLPTTAPTTGPPATAIVTSQPDVVVVPSTVVPSTAPTTVAPVPPTTAPPTLQVSSIVSSFFLDTDRGWLTARIDDTTFQTLRTGDGGGSWSVVDSLTPNITGVMFADGANGWAYDDNSLWATHDGGATWTVFPDLGGDLAGPTALAVADGTLYIGVARSDGVGIDITPIDSNNLTQLDVLLPFGAGPVLDVSLAAQAGHAWMVYNDRLVTGSMRMTNGVIDTTWVPPAADLGGPVHVYADPDGGPLWAVADTGIWAGDVANPRTIVDVSTDGGDTFSDVTPPALADRATSIEIAVVGTSDIAVTTPWGDAGTTLLHSGDEGATWTEVSNVPGFIVGAPRFVSRTVAFAIVNSISDGHQELWRTDDGGATWRPIAIGAVT